MPWVRGDPRLVAPVVPAGLVVRLAPRRPLIVRRLDVAPAAALLAASQQQRHAPPNLDRVLELAERLDRRARRGATRLPAPQQRRLGRLHLEPHHHEARRLDISLVEGLTVAVTVLGRRLGELITHDTVWIETSPAAAAGLCGRSTVE